MSRAWAGDSERDVKTNALDEADLSGRFADSFEVHERRLSDADLNLALVLFAELLEQSPHPRKRHFRRPRLVRHVSRLQHYLHQQLL